MRVPNASLDYAFYDALNHLIRQDTPGYINDFTASYRPDGLLGSFKMYQLNHGAVYNIFDGAQKLFSYIYVPAGDQSPSDPTIAGVYYVNGWGADGITETFLHGRYAPPLQGRPAYFNVADTPIAEIADPLGNISTTAYGNPLALHWRFFDAFGLLTYETLPFYYFDEALAFKGQSGAETYFSGGYDSYEGCNIPGLILMGYRWYNPAIGRFWTRDPQGYDGGINLYAFCRNNPVNRKYIACWQAQEER